MTVLDSDQLLAELEPTVAANLNRHLATAKNGCPTSTCPGVWAETLPIWVERHGRASSRRCRQSRAPPWRSTC